MTFARPIRAFGGHLARTWALYLSIAVLVLVSMFAPGCSVVSSALGKLFTPGSGSSHSDPGAPIVWPYYVAGAACNLLAIGSIGLAIVAPVHAQPRLTVALFTCGVLADVVGYVLGHMAWVLIAAGAALVIAGVVAWRMRTSWKLAGHFFGRAKRC